MPSTGGALAAHADTEASNNSNAIKRFANMYISPLFPGRRIARSATRRAGATTLALAATAFKYGFLPTGGSYASAGAGPGARCRQRNRGNAFEQCAYVIAAERRAEEIALSLRTALQREPLQLAFALDAFGGGLEA